MITKEYRIKNDSGIHAVYAWALTTLVKGYESDVFIKKGTKAANCRSLVSVLGLGAHYGDEVVIACDGVDEDTVMKALIDYLDGLSK